jgi:hypothetical protein
MEMAYNTVMQISAVVLAALLAPSLLAQVPSFRAETRLVEVPVVAVDKKTGKQVTDLTIEDFELLEGSKRQKISHFCMHGSDQAVPRDSRPKLPDGVFTNRVDLRTEGGLQAEPRLQRSGFPRISAAREKPEMLCAP